jgi:hypothetical protein
MFWELNCASPHPYCAMENPAPCARAGLGEGVIGVYGKFGLTRQRELKTGIQSALGQITKPSPALAPGHTSENLLLMSPRTFREGTTRLTLRRPEWLPAGCPRPILGSVVERDACRRPISMPAC